MRVCFHPLYAAAWQPLQLSDPTKLAFGVCARPAPTKKIAPRKRRTADRIEHTPGFNPFPDLKLFPSPKLSGSRIKQDLIIAMRNPCSVVNCTQV
jgi:hypothetical protein